MNVEAITQPSGVVGTSRNAESTESASGIGDFSTALRGAIGEEGAAGGARSDSDTSGQAEQEASKRFAESDRPAEQGYSDDAGDAEDNGGAEENANAEAARLQAEADARDESTAEELAAGSATAAAETGVLGELLAGPQTAAREGAGLSESEEAQGRSSALDTNRRQAAGGRPARRGEEGSAVEVQSRGLTSRGPDSQVLVDGNEADSAAAPANAERRAGLASDSVETPEVRDASRAAESQESPSGVASQVARVAEAGTESLARTTESNGERAAEMAAAQTNPSDSAVSREDEASVRSDSGASGEGASQGDRDGSNESRDFAEGQAAAEQRPSLADGDGQTTAAAEAAATYAAASGNLRADEAVPVESGIAVAGPVALTAPETASAPTAPTANAPQPAAASDAIAVQTEWLATRGGGSARLRLSPAELGEIEIRVTLRGGVVDVVMVAQEAATQTLAEEQSERLAQAFANRDLRMESFDIRRGDLNAASNDASGEFAESSKQGEDHNGQDDQAGGGRDSAAAGQAGGGAASSAPVMPQILSTGPEASVDLRI